MSDCPRLARCPFFNDKLQKMPAVADMAKASYCRSGHFENCARFRVAEAAGAEAVPSNLFPDQLDRVESILKDTKK